MPANTISLGFETPDYSAMNTLAAPVPEKDMPTKTAYPSMTIPGNKGLARALKPGTEITALVTFKVAEVCIRDRGQKDDGPVDVYGGTHVELEAKSMTFENLKVEDTEEVDGKTAFQQFLGKKNKGGDSDEN